MLYDPVNAPQPKLLPPEGLPIETFLHPVVAHNPAYLPMKTLQPVVTFFPAPRPKRTLSLPLWRHAPATHPSIIF